MTRSFRPLIAGPLHLALVRRHRAERLEQRRDRAALAERGNAHRFQRRFVLGRGDGGVISLSSAAMSLIHGSANRGWLWPSGPDQVKPRRDSGRPAMGQSNHRGETRDLTMLVRMILACFAILMLTRPGRRRGLPEA